MSRFTVHSGIRRSVVRTERRAGAHRKSREARADPQSGTGCACHAARGTHVREVAPIEKFDRRSMSSGNEAKRLLGDPIHDQHGIAGVSNRSVQTRALVHSGLRSLGALIAENSNKAYDMSDLAVKTRLSFEMNVQRADLLSTLCWMTTPVCRRTNRERPTHIALGALKLSTDVSACSFQ